jgi:hypothetical protein
MHQISFGGRAPPRPAGIAYSIPPETLAGLEEGGKRGRAEGNGRDGAEKGVP